LGSDNIVEELTAINDMIVEFMQSNISSHTEKIELEDVSAPALIQILKKSVQTMVSLKAIPQRSSVATIQAY